LLVAIIVAECAIITRHLRLAVTYMPRPQTTDHRRTGGSRDGGLAESPVKIYIVDVDGGIAHFELSDSGKLTIH
jgi:hypothetical protein